MVGAAYSRTATRRMPVIDPVKRMRIFSRMHLVRKEIAEKYQKNTLVVSVARCLLDGNLDDFLMLLHRHTLATRELRVLGHGQSKRAQVSLALLSSFYEEVSNELRKDNQRLIHNIKDYSIMKQWLIEKYKARFFEELPVTFELIVSSLELLPRVVAGTARTNPFSHHISWVGKAVDYPMEPQKLVFVFSGGAAKGVFYTGFLKALQEDGLWPDIVVGTSAGAIAAATMATGKGHAELKKTFSRNTLVGVFNPLWLAVTPLITLGKGITGIGLKWLLKKVLGNVKLSGITDMFIIASALYPKFGKTVFGRASSLNDNLSLSSDIEVWKAVLSSTAMPGIIPHVSLKSVRLERLVESDGAIVNEGADFTQVTLNDGGIDENLGILTAHNILRKIGSFGLIVAVNLGNYNPQSMELTSHLSLAERFRAENANIGTLMPKYAKYPMVFYNAVSKWIKQELEHGLNSLSPIRAYRAYEETAYHNVIQSLNRISGQGMMILLNPNSNGSLSRIKLTTFSGADVIEEYGYETGKTLASLLLGDGNSDH